MGGIASKVKGHFWTRPLQRYNIESRTSRLLDRDKPIPAPKYPADIKFAETLGELKGHEKPLESEWDERLKKVYVTSRDPEPDVYNLDRHVRATNPDRPLPVRVPASYRPSKPKKNAPKDLHDGRLTLGEVSDLLMDHRPIVPPGLSVEELKTKYNTERNVHDLVNFYRIFQKYTKEDTVLKEPKHTLLPDSEWVPKKE